MTDPLATRAGVASPTGNRSSGRGRNRGGDMRPGSLDGGILLTIHRLSQGGADRVAMLLANGFAAAGIPTGIAVLRSGGEGEEMLLDMLRDDVALSSAGAPIGSRHLELVRGYAHIRKQIDLAGPALVLASSSNMGLVTGLVARAKGPGGPRFAMKLTNPVIRPSDRAALRKAYRRHLYRFIFQSFERVLILSESERANLAGIFPDQAPRFRTTLNPYVTEEMLSTPPRGKTDGPPLVLTLARMMPQKRLDRLLDAFACLRHPDARLTILGDGPGRAALEQRASALGIAHRVDMPGFVTDVVPWLRRADLFALSSDYEGLPAAALEALACGVPVVTTDCFDDARSLLARAARCAVVPRNDVAALAHAIDASLATHGTSAELKAIASRYRIDAAIADHLAQLECPIAA